MQTNIFINHFKNAFGDYELPVVFWYSDKPATIVKKTKGCFIGDLKPAREGKEVSLNAEAVACPGGKLYAGYVKPPPFLGDFVSGKEHYKATPELVTDFLDNLNIPNQQGKFINFVSIDKIESFENIEGLIFFATPDVLSGLVSWVLFDSNTPDAVSVPFGSGCSSMIAQAVIENQNNGHRTFLGMFDPSARPQVENNILTLTIPLSRFKQLFHTIDKTCLQGTPAWKKVKQRIETAENNNYVERKTKAIR